MTNSYPPSPSLMAQESQEAPHIVRRQLSLNRDLCEQLAARYRNAAPRLIATCARGSSDHAASYGKYLIEVTLGIPVMSAAPSVGSVYGAKMDLRGCVMLCISQSGQSPDLVKNAEWARDSGAFVVSLLNTEGSPLGAASDTVVPLHAGPERSVAATKSYIASLSALLQIAAHLSQNADLLQAVEELPDQLSRAAELQWLNASQALTDCADLLTVGRGYSFGVAQEAALKLKETCAVHAEAFSGAELMHGPLALVRKDYPVLLFSQNDPTQQGLAELTRVLRDKGARVFAAGPAAVSPSADNLSSVPGLHPAAAPIALIQTAYGLLERVAVMRGLNPDKPPHLRKVTETQ